ncbi:MAG TPA: M56 family metallopeptidase [Bryobacteraceae bacterium]|nr:M56 family metallopeptidase [Bryobacteraceae bacterium]
MRSIPETVFDLLLNALLQIGFLTILAAVFSRFVAKARARHQFSFYLAVLLFCVAVPITNTLWHFPSAIVAEQSQGPFLSGAGGVNQPSWIWQGHSAHHSQSIIPAGFQVWISGVWAVFILFRLARFSLAVDRVRRLRRDASVISPARVGMAGQILGVGSRVTLLESAAIDDPVTVGAFRPAILLPGKMLPELGEQDLSAILAHEYGHIRRRDFPIHILCELISMPVAWHPGIRYLMSKISQTREFACDDYAAARVGKRHSYANTLVRLASLCLHVPRRSAVALGIFDGDNLETRIMMLTEKIPSLSRVGLIGLALAASTTFGVGAVLMQAVSLQARAEPASTPGKFAGTWHWMFGGRSFSTMILVRSRSGLTGSVAESRIALDEDGGLLRADPSEDTTPKPITSVKLDGSALHVTVSDGFQFLVSLKDDNHAEIRPVGAPPNMKPIAAERVH